MEFGDVFSLKVNYARLSINPELPGKNSQTFQIFGRKPSGETAGCIPKWMFTGRSQETKNSIVI
jgi:hypothetical protein